MRCLRKTKPNLEIKENKFYSASFEQIIDLKNSPYNLSGVFLPFTSVLFWGKRFPLQVDSHSSFLNEEQPESTEIGNAGDKPPKVLLYFRWALFSIKKKCGLVALLCLPSRYLPHFS